MTGSGGAAAGGFSSARTHGSYGYSTGYLSGSYPRGYRSTGYGYSGVGIPRGSMFLLPAFIMMNRPGYRNRYSRSDNDEDQPPNTTTVTFNEDLIRDDIMIAGFVPNQFTFPLTLLVRTLNTSAAEYSMQNTSCGLNDTPANFPNLFVSLTQAEFIHTEVDFWDTDGGKWTIAAIVIGSICLCCCACKALEKCKAWDEKRSCENWKGGGTEMAEGVPQHGIMNYAQRHSEPAGGQCSQQGIPNLAQRHSSPPETNRESFDCVMGRPVSGKMRATE